MTEVKTGAPPPRPIRRPRSALQIGRGILCVVAALILPLAIPFFLFFIDPHETRTMEILGRIPLIGWVLRTVLTALIWVFTLPYPGGFSWTWGLAFLLWFLFAATFALRRKWWSALVVLFVPLMVFWYLAFTVGGAD